MAVFRLVAMVAAAGLIVAAAPQVSDEQVLRTPSMPEWKLLHKVEPDYPTAALQHRIQGTVRFNVIIGKDGHIERLRLASGHPLLVRAAREAVKQWIYRPTLVGDKPGRVITVIQVEFQLDPSGQPLKNQNRDSMRPAVL